MREPTRVRRHHTREQRDKIVAAYECSPLTQKAFAARAGIGYSTLTLWLRKRSLAKRSAESAFVAVPNLFPPASAAPAYRLQFPRGMIVEVAAGFQSEELGALLQVVQAL